MRRARPRWLDDESAEDVLLGLAQTFRELAAAIETFGQLVQGEAGPTRTVGVAHVQALREALDGLQEARARLDDLLMADSDSQLLELHAAVLSTVKRLMREMDLDERIRRQLRLLPGPAPTSFRERGTHGEQPALRAADDHTR